ncbi:MAG: cbb3-type cytochrome c oxidase subunit II [Candidatus Omnitrophica bacterium]|nr:cbb3-type cytochrome c oxidase subunit II [Candidatus Omnitrophota bacterium]
MERFKTVFLVAGLLFFSFSILVMAFLPWLSFRNQSVKTVSELSQQLTKEFVDLSVRYPENFKKYYGTPSSESYGRALKSGRDIYISEACWHCHSQFVRPVSNEDIRFGVVSEALEYQNELQMPQMFGTRRVGPDLIREWGKHSNDWHAAHFFNPRDVAPTSVMPRYTWFFDKNDQPNKKGLAIIAYVQWLGSWNEDMIKGGKAK